jgi:hypothetical protein
MPPANLVTRAPLPMPAVAALLLAVAVALRIADFGNPIIHVDEQYYLLVGGRVLDGAIPYIDVWDRKPVGLFLLYALWAALPGDGILAYQIAATAFAAGTAIIVHRAALKTGARPTGALAAALAYLIWLPILGGRGGQAPVFYNLAIAAAALLTLRLPSLRTPGAITANGLAACLLAGLAIQLKPSAAFEGAFFGIAHLWALRRFGAVRLIGGGAALLAFGLAPTLAAYAAYAQMGERARDAWWFANVTSILLRPGYPPQEILMRLLGIGAQLSPLILCAGVASRWRRTPEAQLAYGWVVAALLGFLAIGTFFDHYALPLIAPLAVASAKTFGRFPRAMVGALGLALLLVIVERTFVANDRAGARATAAVVARNSGGECPYVFIGDTITYHLAHACLPTPYAFPNMLAYATEQGATGIDEAGEVRRILDRRPPVIVVSTRQLAIWNRGSVDALKAALRSRYRVVFSTPRAGYRTVVYLRNDRPFVR